MYCVSFGWNRDKKKCPFFPPWGDLMAKGGYVGVGAEGGNSGVMEMRGERG